MVRRSNPKKTKKKLDSPNHPRERIKPRPEMIPEELHELNEVNKWAAEKGKKIKTKVSNPKFRDNFSRIRNMEHKSKYDI